MAKKMDAEYPAAIDRLFKPLSVATVDTTFIKRMCGEGFYNQYK